MKTRLCFDFTLEEDGRDASEMYLKAVDAFIVLNEITDHIRSICKYQELSMDVATFADELRTEIWKIINDRNIGHLV